MTPVGQIWVVLLAPDFMNIDYVLLPLGLSLLGIPSPAIATSRIRARLRHPARRRDEGLKSLARSWVNWADLVRAWVGVWLIQRVLRASSGQDDLATVNMGAEMAILCLAVLAQTFWVSRSIRVVGPIFFLTGLTLSLSGPMVGGFALVFGLACALMYKRLSLAFLVIPAGILGFGMLFHQVSLFGLLNATAFLIPEFLAFAFRQRLAFIRSPITERTIRPAEAAIAFPVGAKLEEASVIRADFTVPPPTPKATTPRVKVKLKRVGGAALRYEPAAELNLPPR